MPLPLCTSTYCGTLRSFCTRVSLCLVQCFSTQECSTRTSVAGIRPKSPPCTAVSACAPAPRGPQHFLRSRRSFRNAMHTHPLLCAVFYHAESFDQDIGRWNVGKVTSIYQSEYPAPAAAQPCYGLRPFNSFAVHAILALSSVQLCIPVQSGHQRMECGQGCEHGRK